MAEENPVYVKFGYSESAGAKIDLLSSEMSLLNILKIAKRYDSLREKELEIKSNIYKNIKKLDLAMKKTKAVFPFINIPKNIKRKELNKKETKIITEENVDEGLESQLNDIQERLKSISRY